MRKAGIYLCAAALAMPPPKWYDGNEQKNTETTKDDQKDTETTKDDNKKDELEIITNTTKTDNTTEKTTQDQTVSQEKELPKTGVTTVALIVLAVVAIGTISLIRYKNIEIK